MKFLCYFTTVHCPVTSKQVQYQNAFRLLKKWVIKGFNADDLAVFVSSLIRPNANLWLKEAAVTGFSINVPPFDFDITSINRILSLLQSKKKVFIQKPYKKYHP